MQVSAYKIWWPGNLTEELYHGYRNVGTSEHGNVRLRQSVGLRLSVCLRLSASLCVRLRRVGLHKTNNYVGIDILILYFMCINSMPLCFVD